MFKALKRVSGFGCAIVFTVFSGLLVAADEPRPNLVFILSDDHRADVLGCAGHPIVQTPNLDRLAGDGVRFENAFVTTSICAASRATIFTGRYERGHRYTFRTVPLAKEMTDVSYPALLRDAGYRTGFIGKFGVDVQAGVREQMFDWFKPLNRSPYRRKLANGEVQHITDTAGDLALEFLAEQSEDQPFCLSISFNAAHAEDGDKKDHFPWPESTDGLYEDMEMPRPKLDGGEYFDSQPDFLKESFNRVRYFWRWDTPEKYQKNMRGYYRMLTGLDRTVGRVVQALEDHGQLENTVIIFCGDNGYYMGERGFAGKWSHYEESLRVPLLAFDGRKGRQGKGRVASEMVLNLDVAATLIDLAGLEIPSGYQGRSLRGLIDNEATDDWRSDFLIEHLMHVPGKIPKYEGVRDKRWVYARYFEQQPVYEFLHDLESDPQQLTNLAADPAFADVLEKMRSRCDEIRDNAGGEYSLEKFPLKN